MEHVRSVLLLALLLTFMVWAAIAAARAASMDRGQLSHLRAELETTQAVLIASEYRADQAESQLAAERAANTPTPRCVRVEFGAAVWEGTAFFRIGETALCATEGGRLVWSNAIYGPVFNEEKELAEVYNSMSRWRDCAESLDFCPKGFARTK